MRLARQVADEQGGKFGEIFRESRVWYVREYTRGSEGGRRLSTGQKTRKAALAWCKKREREGLGPLGRTSRTVEEAVCECLEYLREGGDNGKPPRDITLRDYGYQTAHWTRRFQGRPLMTLTPEDIRKSIHSRMTATNKKGEVVTRSACLWNTNVILWKSFVNWCCDEERNYLERNITKKLRLRPRPVRDPRYLTADEVRELLRCCQEEFTVEKETLRNAGGREGKKRTSEKSLWTERRAPPAVLYPIVVLGLTSLLRRGNILGLRWGDLDLRKNEIWIPGERMKNDNDLRIPLAPAAKKAILELPRGGPKDLVFSITDIKRPFCSAMSRAGIRGATFHCLRKTGATHLREKGVRLEVTMDLGDWSKRGRVMLTHYAGTSWRELQEAVAVLDALVTGLNETRSRATGDTRERVGVTGPRVDTGASALDGSASPARA